MLYLVQSFQLGKCLKSLVPSVATEEFFSFKLSAYLWPIDRIEDATFEIGSQMNALYTCRFPIRHSGNW